MADRFYPSDPADAEVENGIWIHPSDDDTGSYRYKVNDRGYSFDPSAVIIAVDGACRGNGNPWARAAYGIYFGPRNWWNECQTLDNSESGSRNWTSQRAELWAALRALRKAHSLRARWDPNGDDDDDLEKVIVKADSEYVVKGMTEWVHKWLDNGWTNCKGLPVINADLFTKLVQQVRTLRGIGVEVLFWHVPRERNWQADELANDALDEEDDDEY